MNIELLESKISELENENEMLREWQQNANQVLSIMLKENKELEQRLKLLEEQSTIQQYDILVCKGRINSMPYDILDSSLELPICKPNIMTSDETLDKIIHEHKSMARFGDGEFGLIGGVQRWRFQNADLELGAKLKTVLQSSEEDFMIALNPDFYRNFIDLPDNDIIGEMSYMTSDVRKQHAQLLDEAVLYADALCFRGLKSIQEFNKLSSLWRGRDCLFIEGEHSGLGVGNSLFSASKSINRIICPSENAYEKYQEILDAALSCERNMLVIIALGPTASVLSYDLYKAGFQAIDVGMLDLQYEAVVRGEHISDLVLPNKCCGLDIIKGDREIKKIDDPEYTKQIYKVIL